MNKIKLEIEKESYRFNCPNYQGVIFVHPEEVKTTLFLLKTYGTLSVKGVSLSCGGNLKVSTVEGVHPQYNYSGWELTSTLISLDCFGKYDNSLGEYKKVGSVGCEEFIMYMASRSGRSPSKHHAHLLLF